MGEKLSSAILSVPVDALKFHTLNACDNVQVFEGAAGNLPDENSMRAAEKIKQKVTELTQVDILFVLITGGGSALLPLPMAPITLTEKSQLISQLSRAGATIEELNTVRIAISQVKGGKLARMSRAHRIVSFIISDIVGDPLHLIASGPTVQPTSEQLKQSPRDILEKYNLFGSLSQSVYDVLMAGAAADAPAQSRLDNCHSILIGNNQIAIDAAIAKAREHRLIPVHMSSRVQGDVSVVSRAFFQLAQLIANFHMRQKKDDDDFVEQIANLTSILSARSNFANDLVAALAAIAACNNEDVDDDDETDKAGICIISGGETTVRVSGDGLGGRNQELALRFTQLCCRCCEEASMSSLNDLLQLCGGTDGLDGNNTAAGAIGGHIDAEPTMISEFLNRNDSYNFYRRHATGRYHIITGHTGTNVMDIQLMVVMMRGRKRKEKIK